MPLISMTASRSTLRLAVTVAVASVALVPAVAWAAATDVADAPTDQTVNNAIAASGEQAASTGGSSVEVPQQAGSGVRMAGDHGAAVTLGLPASGAVNEEGSTAEYSGSAPQTEVAVQKTAAGARALVEIVGSEAPERYTFPMGGDAARLRSDADGSVDVLDADGTMIGAIAAPWAIDADGRSVPTSFEVVGTSLVQVVEHVGADFAYPLVADPSFFSVLRCGAAVAAFAAGNGLIIFKIRKAGGVVKVAKIILGKGSYEAKLKAVLAITGNVFGVNQLFKECGVTRR